ncbi:tyrosine-protein phosphatase [Microbacterium suaedae]|uniref:tyrosine-protein phosphatase n=1 Tax=Microbacterium suaedae TaxID=2067813 RepID=UPI001E651768|nr:tyrosine-protein phosphatase [Microbacterium suaedae]
MRSIAVDGLFNVRAIGAQAPWLVRSGATDGLTKAGERALRTLGVSVVIDLREPDEADGVRHGIPALPVPVYGEAPPQTGRIEDIYVSLLRERGPALTSAVAHIADAEGAALVHCTAGKDRTGLVVALARRVAGDADADIIDDYARSGPEVRPVREAVARDLADAADASARPDVLRLHLDSPPEAIASALALVDELGGTEAYLRGHGLGGDRIAALRRRREEAA